MRLIVFEDTLTNNFRPLTYTKPVFDLVNGIGTLFESINFTYPKIDSLIVQPHLADITQRNYPSLKVNKFTLDDDSLFLNGLIKPTSPIIKDLFQREGDFIAIHNDNVIMAKLNSHISKDLSIDFPLNFIKELDSFNLDTIAIDENVLFFNIWDLIKFNSDSIIRQFSEFEKLDYCGIKKMENPEIYLRGDHSKLFISDNVDISRSVSIDVRSGPVIILDNSFIDDFTVLYGPLFIGNNCEIKSARITNSSLGPYCKIGGEVDSSIIEKYSNKSHEGYLGHSYVGQFVNMGSGTITSDLKNTYGSIKINTNSGKIDSHMTKLGSFFADYSKTSIGSLIYAGCSLGVSSHLHGYMLKNIPSFAIYGEGMMANTCELEIDSAIKTQKIMMERRNLTQTNTDSNLLNDVFKITNDDRKNFGVVKQRFHFS